MITCPNCDKKIPDDSVFCDQCGVHLKQCPQCGKITLENFCEDCGNTPVERQLPANQPQPAQPAPQSQPAPQAQPQPAQAPASGTVIIDLSPVLNIVHSSFTITPASGDVLGRTTGPHVNYLGQFPVISGRHARVELVGKEWFFEDTGSSNGSFINGERLAPNTKAKLSDGDSLVLADVPFTVSIK